MCLWGPGSLLPRALLLKGRWDGVRPHPHDGGRLGQSLRPSRESWSGNELGGWRLHASGVAQLLCACRRPGRAWGSWRVAGLLPVAAGTSVLEVGVLGATPQLLWFSAWGFSIRCCGPRWGGAVKDTGARCAAVHGVAGPDTNEGLDSDSSESVMALTHVTFRSVSGSVSSCL